MFAELREHGTQLLKQFLLLTLSGREILGKKKTTEKFVWVKTELLWRTQEENHEALFGKMTKGF